MPKPKESIPLEIHTQKIDHLGLIASMIRYLGIQAFFDNHLTKNSQHKVSHGQVIVAMILLSFAWVNRRIYLFPKHLRRLALEPLIGPGLKPEDFNESVVGRTLDAIFKAGVTKLFALLILSILSKITQGKDQRFHVDSTSISVYGRYPNQSEEHAGIDPEEGGAITINFGYSKDHRPDLKQFVLDLCTNQDGIPLMMIPQSGNASDRTTLMQTIQQMQHKIQKELSESQKVIYIADSAFYTEKNIQNMGKESKFISHPPQTIKFVQIFQRARKPLLPTYHEDYKMLVIRSRWAGVEQQFAVIESKELKTQQLATFDKEIQKERNQAKKSLAQLVKQRFYCEKDARKALEKWNKAHPLFLATIDQIETKIVQEDGSQGKITPDTPTLTLYQIQATLSDQQEEIQRKKEFLGRFMLATNDLSLNGDAILRNYKEQSQVESGFRFFKGKVLRVSDVFLKSTRRITALTMIMVLTLLIHTLLERGLRQSLEQSGEKLRDHKNKPVTNPTMHMVFEQFEGIYLHQVTLQGQTIQTIQGLDENQRKILSLLGPDYEKMYQ